MNAKDTSLKALLDITAVTNNAVANLNEKKKNRKPYTPYKPDYISTEGWKEGNNKWNSLSDYGGGSNSSDDDVSSDPFIVENEEYRDDGSGESQSYFDRHEGERDEWWDSNSKGNKRTVDDDEVTGIAWAVNDHDVTGGYGGGDKEPYRGYYEVQSSNSGENEQTMSTEQLDQNESKRHFDEQHIYNSRDTGLVLYNTHGIYLGILEDGKPFQIHFIRPESIEFTAILGINLALFDIPTLRKKIEEINNKPNLKEVASRTFRGYSMRFIGKNSAKDFEALALKSAALNDGTGIEIFFGSDARPLSPGLKELTVFDTFPRPWDIPEQYLKMYGYKINANEYPLSALLRWYSETGKPVPPYFAYGHTHTSNWFRDVNNPAHPMQSESKHEKANHYRHPTKPVMDKSFGEYRIQWNDYTNPRNLKSPLFILSPVAVTIYGAEEYNFAGEETYPHEYQVYEYSLFKR